MVGRIATMDSTSPDAVRDAEKIIENKLSIGESVGYAEIGGTKYMANILNLVDRSTREIHHGGAIPQGSQSWPRRSATVCSSLKTSLRSIRCISSAFCRTPAAKICSSRLKGCSKEIADVFYENMSTRLRQTLEEETKYMHGVKLSDVEQAQKKLVSLVRTLGDAGEIIIDRGRKDDIIV